MISIKIAYDWYHWVAQVVIIAKGFPQMKLVVGRDVTGLLRKSIPNKGSSLK